MGSNLPVTSYWQIHPSLVSSVLFLKHQAPSQEGGEAGVVTCEEEVSKKASAVSYQEEASWLSGHLATEISLQTSRWDGLNMFCCNRNAFVIFICSNNNCFSSYIYNNLDLFIYYLFIWYFIFNLFIFKGSPAGSPRKSPFKPSLVTSSFYGKKNPVYLTPLERKALKDSLPCPAAPAAPPSPTMTQKPEKKTTKNIKGGSKPRKVAGSSKGGKMGTKSYSTSIKRIKLSQPKPSSRFVIAVDTSEAFFKQLLF